MGVFVITNEKTIIDEIISRTLLEDLGPTGDVTTDAIFNNEDQASAVIKSKSRGVLSGCFLLEPIFRKIDPGIKIDMKAADGDNIEKGTVICLLNGPVKCILAGERTSLNFLQRLSGIATMTSQFAKAIAHTSARLLDTRKTTPMLRLLEKKAVEHGGGCNHRFGLYDMILIKDTHVKRAGGVRNALLRAIDYNKNHRKLKIEVEIQSVQEFLEALELNPDRIMLDNMNVDDMRTCVDHKRIKGSSVELEASGNVSLSTISAIAETGVDFISSGAITHSAPSLDIHLVIT